MTRCDICEAQFERDCDSCPLCGRDTKPVGIGKDLAADLEAVITLLHALENDSCNRRTGHFKAWAEIEDKLRAVMTKMRTLVANNDSHRAWTFARSRRDPCSLYQEYTLRVEVKAAGAWHAETNWSECEVEQAIARAAELRADPVRKPEEVRVIRMRFEVVKARQSGAALMYGVGKQNSDAP